MPGAVPRRRAAAQGAVTAGGASGTGATRFGYIEAIEAIGAQSRRLSEAVGSSDLDARVPTTPEWSVRDLAHHIGVEQWYWAENVRAQNADERTGGELTALPEDSDLLAWLGWCTYSLRACPARRRPRRAVLGVVAGAAHLGRGRAASGAGGGGAPLGRRGCGRRTGAARRRAGRGRGSRVHRDHGGVRPRCPSRRGHVDGHRYRRELARRRRRGRPVRRGGRSSGRPPRTSC